MNAYCKKNKPSAPNYRAIKTAIEDNNSNYFYPKLLERYQLNDTTLSIIEYRHLYFGYIFQENYDPDWRCECIDTLVTYYRKEKLNTQDCDSIIKYASLCISKNPFDLRQLNMIGYAYHLKGQEDIAITYALKSAYLKEAIFSTGTGKKAKKALHVISVSHEYEIIKSLGLFSSGQELIGMKYDYMSIHKNPMNIKGFYFNIEKIFEHRQKMFK